MNRIDKIVKPDANNSNDLILFVTLGALIICILSIACGGPANVDTSIVADSRLDSPYSHTDKLFEMQPPKDWQAVEGGWGALVVFANPEPDLLDDLPFSANINVISESAQGLGLEGYVDFSKELLATFFTSYELLEEKKATVNGKEAYFLSSSFTQGDFPLTNLQLVLINEDTEDVITATSLQETWAEYEAIFDASLRSFKVE